MRLVVAGGGTGGHVFPGVSVSKKFLEMDKDNKILYVGTKSGMESILVPKFGLDLELLSLGGIKGKSLAEKAVNFIRVLAATFNSVKILKKFKPDAVFGVGGYASYPTLFAAKILGIKTAILEQNTVAGLANRVLGKFVDRIYTAFDYTERFFPKRNVLLTGNPLREEIIKIAKTKRSEKSKSAVLVLGGSQGSKNLNHKVIESLEFLRNFKDKIVFIHQTGTNDLEFVKDGYSKLEFDAEVYSFIDDIARAFTIADLVISRSGSGICEILAAGKPSILVPYPHSSYGHQDLNADLIVKEGAGIKITDSALEGKKLAEIIIELLENRNRLNEMSKNALRIARPDATERVVNDLLNLCIDGTNV